MLVFISICYLQAPTVNKVVKATVLEVGRLIIDESKTNATNTHEENTEVTDAANTTDAVYKKNN